METLGPTFFMETASSEINVNFDLFYKDPFILDPATAIDRLNNCVMNVECRKCRTSLIKSEFVFLAVGT